MARKSARFVQDGLVVCMLRGARACMISLVSPIYNEQEVLPRLHRELAAAMDSTGLAWEIIYVDDGSSDQSLSILLGFENADSRVCVVELSRNWGHQAAITAGLSVARGDAVVLIDGDLQDPPSVVPALLKEWQSGAEVIVAQRRSRSEHGLRKYLFPLFYRVLGFLSDYPIPLNTGIFGLMDRRAVDAVLKLTETNRFLPGLRAWVGFRTAVVFYDREDRASGEPKQSLSRLLKYALDAIFSFSYKPLRLGLLAGLTIAALSFLLGVFLIVCRVLGVGLFGSPQVYGWTSTVVFIVLFAGVQLTSIGILGEYIGRIYDEVKRRPLFFIRKVHQTSDLPVARELPKEFLHRN
jgi:glycosyltransferase involved in cell wall biosynthesis